VTDFHRSFLADNPAHEPEDCSLFARLPAGTERQWWRKEPTMDAELVEATLKMHVKEMRERLECAAGIGKAAQACADAGNIEKAIEIALDVEQLIYEVNTFLNAASMINRISKT
jgi:hypothetical protein